MQNRRDFCKAAGAALMVPAFLRPFAAQAATSNSHILVAIMLAGGNDGLNTVIPLTQYGTYTDLRKPLNGPSGNQVNIPLASLAATAFESDFRVPASKSTTYAFNPTMTALRSLYAKGKVAVINGVGIPPIDTNRLSHQTGQFDWQSGTVNQTGQVATGWLGQALDSAPGGSLPAMMSLSGELPLLMQGKVNSPLVLNPPLENFSISYGTNDQNDAAQRELDFRRIANAASGSAPGEFVRGVSLSATKLVNVVQDVAHFQSAAGYPKAQTYLSQQLEQIARVILSGSGVSAYFAVQGGYDTHSGQQNVQPGLLGDLSDSIAGFYTYLASKGASRNVTIMTFSDFGRRAESNSTFGTDHGTSSVAFAVGDPVKGGTYGNYSNLKKLDQDGNLVVQVDFRNQISDMIGYLGADAASILGQTYPKLGFI
jgi:uncharacterized protein (DUF1501 family)